MMASTRKGIRHLAGAFCAAALLTGTVGVASAAAVPQTAKATAESPNMSPRGHCTGYHYDSSGMRTWDPPGCTPP